MYYSDKQIAPKTDGLLERRSFPELYTNAIFNSKTFTIGVFRKLARDTTKSHLATF